MKLDPLVIDLLSKHGQVINVTESNTRITFDLIIHLSFPTTIELEVYVTEDTIGVRSFLYNNMRGDSVELVFVVTNDFSPTFDHAVLHTTEKCITHSIQKLQRIVGELTTTLPGLCNGN